MTRHWAALIHVERKTLREPFDDVGKHHLVRNVPFRKTLSRG